MLSRIGHIGPVGPETAGVALLRLAAVLAAALAVVFVLATFVAGTRFEDETVGIETLRTAVYFFGPIAAILMLAFIVILALTRPASMVIPHRRRAARIIAIIYMCGGILAAVALRQVGWGWALALASAAVAAGSYAFLHRSETAHRGNGLPPSLV